jgi:hypothetical protein
MFNAGDPKGTKAPQSTVANVMRHRWRMDFLSTCLAETFLLLWNTKKYDQVRT